MDLSLWGNCVFNPKFLPPPQDISGLFSGELCAIAFRNSLGRSDDTIVAGIHSRPGRCATSNDTMSVQCLASDNTRLANDDEFLLIVSGAKRVALDAIPRSTLWATPHCGIILV